MGAIAELQDKNRSTLCVISHLWTTSLSTLSLLLSLPSPGGKCAPRERITRGRAKIAGEHLLCGPGRAEPGTMRLAPSLLSQGSGAGPALKGPFDTGDKGAAAGPVPLSARPGGRHPQSRGEGLRCPALLPAHFKAFLDLPRSRREAQGAGASLPRRAGAGPAAPRAQSAAPLTLRLYAAL